MNIVIVGAGDIGLHLATILSQIGMGIILIDRSRDRLELAARELDVVTKLGSGTDWELLAEALEIEPDLFVALTDDDETNLVACTIAKNLGYPQTIARVRSNKYFMQSRLPFERLFYIDHLIGPEKLTAYAIASMILKGGALSSESFANGGIKMRTLKIPPTWKKGHISMREKEALGLPSDLMVALISRRGEAATGKRVTEKLIFPHGGDQILVGDEVTFIGESAGFKKLYDLLGIPLTLPKSVAIIGGSLVAIHLAKSLHEHAIDITIVDKDPEKCRILSEMLPWATIMRRNGTDYRFLEMEKLASADFFVAATRSDETNFLSAAAASHLGASHIIVSLSDTAYLPLLKNLGIYSAASPRLVAANRILSIAREQKVVSMVSLYDNKAEVMEVKVSVGSKIAGIPIRHLASELPKDFLIAAIQSRGRVFIADGSRVLSPGDTAIVISTPRHMEEIRKIF